MTRSTRHFGINFSSPALWMTLFAVLAIWLGIDLAGFAHRIARARQLLGHMRSAARSDSELQAVADNLLGVSSGVMRCSAALIAGAFIAVIVAAFFDWAPRLVRIAIVCGLVLALLLLSLLQGIS